MSSFIGVMVLLVGILICCLFVCFVCLLLICFIGFWVGWVLVVVLAFVLDCVVGVAFGFILLHCWVGCCLMGFVIGGWWVCGFVLLV